MPRRRATPLDHDEALAVCERIKVKHPDILDRPPDGLYRYQLGNPVMREALFDYLACQRVADAFRAKQGARDADLDRLSRAVETY